MDYAKVKSGDELKLKAEVWNGLIDLLQNANATNNYQRPSQRFLSTPIAADVVPVRNDSGGNVERYRILKLVEPLILPADNENEFQRRVIISGDTPDEDSAGRWGVLIDSLNDNQIGRCVVIGAIQCRINLVDVADVAVEAADGSVIPNSGLTGSGEILWVAGGVGTADATGEQWAIIRLGGGAAPSLPTPQYQFMVLQAVSQNVLGADFVRCHPEI